MKTEMEPNFHHPVWKPTDGNISGDPTWSDINDQERGGESEPGEDTSSCSGKMKRWASELISESVGCTRSGGEGVVIPALPSPRLAFKRILILIQYFKKVRSNQTGKAINIIVTWHSSESRARKLLNSSVYFSVFQIQAHLLLWTSFGWLGMDYNLVWKKFTNTQIRLVK